MGTQLLSAAAPDVIRAMQQSQEAADRDAKATYQRLAPVLTELFIRDGSAFAEAVGYDRSQLLANPEGHACVTISITGLSQWTGACMNQAIQLTQCGANYEAGLSPGRMETHNTITFMCPLPQRVYDAKFTIAAAGTTTLPQFRDRRGVTRRFLEDTCSVWACFVLLLKMLVATFVVHRVFDVSLSENILFGFRVTSEVAALYRRIVT